jgi:chorismate-pyruvate lyase
VGALGGTKTSLLRLLLKAKAPLGHLPSQAQLAQRRAEQLVVAPLVVEAVVEVEVANLPWKWLR